MNFIRLILLVGFLCGELSGTSQHLCDTPQYLELGKIGTINCSIPHNFRAISWYNSTDYNSEFPVIYIADSVKDGFGYVSGEYDITIDGSLIITKVLPKHDRFFTLLLLFEETRNQVVSKVRVVVTAKPKQQFPYVYNCGQEKRICLQQGTRDHFNCSVMNALPIVPLEWIMRTAEGDESISFQTFLSVGEVGYTSSIATTLPSNSTVMLHLLVCKAHSVPPLLAKNESLVLVDPKKVNLSTLVPISANVLKQTRLELLCTSSKISFFIWKRKQASDKTFSDLCFGVSAGEKYKELFSDQFYLAESGSLIIPSVDVKDEGLYGCISSDGLTNQAVVYNVTVDGLDETMEEHFHPTRQSNLPETPALLWIILLFIILLFLFMCGLFVMRCISKGRALKRTNKMKNTDEEVSMMEAHTLDSKDWNDLKEQFLKELTEKYKDLYNGVQPIPYLRHKLYCVDKVFVDVNIELLVSLEEVGYHSVWQDIGSYQNIFEDPRAKSTRRIIESDPGYGKSMITLQLAYDWCNRQDSSALGDVEILILLRLRQLRGVKPIYRVIKQLLLPKDSRISEEDIQKILSESKKVLILLDGFDEYSDYNDDAQSDINDILERKMFQEFEVILTTRSLILPRKVSSLTKRLRLSGFDENAQKCYTQKAVVSRSDDGTDKITQNIKNNPILSDLCQVPLFFVIFAHMMHKSDQFRNLNSVTSLFHYMISCFNSHMEKKMEDENDSKHTKLENGHYKFTKMAFECLRKSSKSIIWSREEVCQEVSGDVYERYRRIGILVEEEVIEVFDEKGGVSSGSIKTLTRVRFFHKIFCEWYAAHYLADYLQQHPSLELSEFLQLHDPADLQYLYRFACGLNSFAAAKIIDFLQNLEGGDIIAILCILEKPGDATDIMEQIRKLCMERLIVSGYDSLLLQRSYLQLLELAAKNDIPINSLSLHNCLKTVDVSQKMITIQSGLTFPARIPIKELVITLSHREIEETEATNILEFSTLCQNLKLVGFYGCVPPFVFAVGSITSTLKSKNIRVWCRTLRNSPMYILDLDSGKWKEKENGSEATEEQWQNLLQKRADMVQSKTEEDYKKNVREGREKYKREADQTPSA